MHYVLMAYVKIKCMTMEVQKIGKEDFVVYFCEILTLHLKLYNIILR